MRKFMIHKPLNLQGTCNTRELGCYPAFSGTTQMYRCLRSDNLHNVTKEDITFLKKYEVRRIIDLRSEEEVRSYPEAQHWGTEIEYFHVPLDDKVASKGYKGEFPETMGQLYRHFLSNEKKKLAQILEIIADAPDGAVLFNCAVGKDRTGVVSMLLLKICGVPDDVIVADYGVSGENIRPIVEQQKALLKEYKIECPEYIFHSKEKDMWVTLKYLEEEFGGIGGYLQEIGLSGAHVWKILNRML